MKSIRSCFLISVFACAAIHTTAQSTITIGDSLRLKSAILGEERNMMVYKPASYAPGNDRFPVLYLLDGETNFMHTIGTVQFLADRGMIPQMIVVGIRNVDRGRDYTPSQVENFNSGGGDNFLRFISDELIPHIDRNYRTTKNRILVGHSLGGLMVTHALITQPEVYTGYLAISPSLWWNEGAWVKKAEDFLKSQPVLNKFLYVTLGDEQGMRVDDFIEVLKKNSPRGFEWDSRTMTDENHGTVPHRSTYLGLKFICENWNPAPPKIGPEGVLIPREKPLEVTLSAKKGMIYYTLDGTEPTRRSAVYSGPILLGKPVVLKARTIVSDQFESKTAEAEYQMAVLRPAEKKLRNLKQGLSYKYVEGSWNALPDFKTLTPKMSGNVRNVDITMRNINDKFGFEFSGYIDIQQEGIYTFFLKSDDGSKLFIGDKLVVNHDGDHDDREEKSGQIMLARGKHPLRIQFYENAGGEVIDVKYEGPGIAKTKIPDNKLFY